MRGFIRPGHAIPGNQNGSPIAHGNQFRSRPSDGVESFGSAGAGRGPGKSIGGGEYGSEVAHGDQSDAGPDYGAQDGGGGQWVAQCPSGPKVGLTGRGSGGFALGAEFAFAKAQEQEKPDAYRRG